MTNPLRSARARIKEKNKMAKAKPKKQGMARLLELAFTKKLLISISAVLATASAVSSFVPFVAVYYVIRELALNMSDLSALDTKYMTSLGFLAVGGVVAAVALNFCALACSHITAFKVLYKLKLDFARHIAALPLGFHTQNSTGKLRKVIDENIEKLEGFIAHQFPDLVGALVTPVTAVALLFFFDWRMGLCCLVPLLLLFIMQAAAAGGKRGRENLRKYQDSLEDMNNAAVEYVRGISVVKAFNQTVFSFRRFYDSIKNYGDWALGYTKSFRLPMVLFLTLLNAIYLFLIPALIFLYEGVRDVTDYPAFALSALFYIIFSMALPGLFMKIMYVAHGTKQISDGIARMDSVMGTPALPETKTPKQTNEYSVTFDNVTFSYDEEGETVALNGINFTAKQGEITALVGPSGGGKSTIAHLIPRFYDVAGGAIRIGGVDVRDMNSDYLMSVIGFVFQDVFLFKQSIIDNLLVGNPKATREEAILAAKAAHCHYFIEKLPKGYDTVIGTAGIRLSGGERQRIVIARAILKNAPILVLDEATAFADPENEQKIQQALSELIKNKTVIMIAHRLSTVRGADKIIVMENGAVAEQGRNADLLAARGKYSRMWEQYLAALDWAIAKGEKNHA
jgi:ATP-binding cassette subfamily B protein